MKFRHTFLIGRVAAFALLLISAGAASVSVASNSQDAGQTQVVDTGKGADFAQTQFSTTAAAQRIDF